MLRALIAGEMLLVLAVVAVGVTAALVFRGWRMDKSTDPVKFSQIAFNRLNPTGSYNRPHLRLEIDVDYFAGTPTGKMKEFCSVACKIVPSLFAKFPDMEVCELSCTSKTNLSGGEKGGRYFMAEFDRHKSASTPWSNIAWHDVPKAANSFWQHPMFDQPNVMPSSKVPARPQG
jgi:hypothetical protein